MNRGQYRTPQSAGGGEDLEVDGQEGEMDDEEAGEEEDEDEEGGIEEGEFLLCLLLGYVNARCEEILENFDLLHIWSSSLFVKRS